MTADPLGGVWNYALELCAALGSHYVRVSLATLGGAPSAQQQAQLARLPYVTVYPSRFRLEWMAAPWEDLERAGQWLLALERSIQPDIVHLNHLVHADLPWQAPVLSVGHSCVLSWWQAVHGAPAPPEWGRYQERVRKSLRAAQVVVAPTAAQLRALERYYGPFRQARVIHNARSYKLFNTARKEPLVLAAGRLWDGAKNIAALAAVASQVAAPIAVAGAIEGPDGQTATVPGVRLLGSLGPEQLAGWYARAAVYALPARYEPFGLTAVEAALSGCALVLGDIDSLREVWGAAARYVHPDDHVGLRETLNELLANDLLRDRLAARAMGRARQLKPSRLGQAYLGVYRSLIGVHGGGRGAATDAHRAGPRRR